MPPDAVHRSSFWSTYSTVRTMLWTLNVRPSLSTIFSQTQPETLSPLPVGIGPTLNAGPFFASGFPSPLDTGAPSGRFPFVSLGVSLVGSTPGSFFLRPDTFPPFGSQHEPFVDVGMCCQCGVPPP